MHDHMSNFRSPSPADLSQKALKQVLVDFPVESVSVPLSSHQSHPGGFLLDSCASTITAASEPALNARWLYTSDGAASAQSELAMHVGWTRPFEEDMVYDCSPEGSLHRKRYQNLPDLRAKFANSASDKITTLMFKGLPRKMIADELLAELESVAADQRSFDFFYMPWDKCRNANKGFAFVNFVSDRKAASVREGLNGRILVTSEGKHRAVCQKRLNVTTAHVQGLQANLLHYVGKVVAEDGYEHPPHVYADGVRIPFAKALEMVGELEDRFPHSNDLQDNADGTLTEFKRWTSTASTQMPTKNPASSSNSDVSAPLWSHEAIANMRAQVRTEVNAMAEWKQQQQPKEPRNSTVDAVKQAIRDRSDMTRIDVIERVRLLNSLGEDLWETTPL